MSDTTIKAYQVIDDDLEFHSANLEEALSTPNTQRPLYCSIIGSQSSGKSSILNQIAGQSLFKVMDRSNGFNKRPKESIQQPTQTGFCSTLKGQTVSKETSSPS